MKKLMLILMLAALACIGFAQVASYTFGYSAGTYSEITGGTVLGTATLGGSSDTALDNVTYPSVSIPFLFAFNGRRYNTVTVNSNGYVVFGGTSAIAESSQLSNSAVCGGIVAAMGRDLQGNVLTGSLGEMRYQTLGSSPDRTFVIQYKNFIRYVSGGNAESYNFQIRFNENGNTIQMVYGPMTVNSTSNTCQVGLRGTVNTDYLTRTTTTDWTTTAAGTTNAVTMALTTTVYPPNGSTYTFTPPAPTAAPNVATVVSPTDGNPSVFAGATLNWADGGGWTEGFKLYFSPTSSFPPATPLNLGYVTSYDPPGDMDYTTPYSWKVVPYNTAFGENTTGSVWTFTTAGAPLSGTKTIGGTGADYATFTAAINALNGAGVSPTGVTFNVADGTYNENPPAITTSGTASGRIVFQAATGANPVVTPAGGALTFGFKLNGADYITFDNIDVTGPTTLIYGYWLAALTANGATNNIIQNCTITVPYGSSTNYGIYSLGVTDGANGYNSFLSNNILNSYHGIYLTGSSTAGSEAYNVAVTSNTLTGIRNYGIYAGYMISCPIYNNNVGFYSGGTTAYYGIYTVGSASTYEAYFNTISGGYTSSTVYGLYNSSSLSTVYYGNNITNLYNTGSSGWYGFYAGGGTTTWNYNNIYGIANTGTAAVYSAYVTTGNHEFKNNNLYDIATGGTSLYGFYVIGGTTHSIYNNKIYNLRYTGTGAGIVYGIHLGSGTTNSVYNNMVYDLRAAGSTSSATAPAIRAISISSGTTNNVWNNTVFLDSSGSNTAFSTAALYVSTSSNTIDLKNNIFVNKSTPGATGRAVAFWKTSAGISNLSATSDKNIYYTAETPDATHLIGYFSTTAYPTLAEYKTMAATKDQGSYTENVPFVRNTDPYNVHIDSTITTRVEGNAIPIVPPVSFDIDNEGRNASTPDIGADEGDFLAPAGAPGLVTLLAPADEARGINPITGQLSWSAPVLGGAPAEYWVYVSDSLNNIYTYGYTVVAVPNTNLTLADVITLPIEFGHTYYWAVQASNDDGQSDAEDPAFQIWSFNTGDQLSASETLAIGNAWPSNPKTGTIAVTNLGLTSLTFNATGSAEFVFGGTGTYTIPASSSYNVPYTFNAPATPGAYTGSITLTQTSPAASTLVIAVTANISTNTIVGTGTTEFPLPTDPYFGYGYSQTIYYPSELGWPSGYRIEKLYYYFNGFETCESTSDFTIYMGHTSNATFASTTDWVPLTGLTQVYSHSNIPQQLTGGYWMEFVLDTPFIYNGTSNLVIAVDENLLGYDTTDSFFYGTASTGVNRSIQYRADSTNPDPAAPPTGILYAGYPNTKFFVAPVPVNPVIAVNPSSWDYGTVIVNTTNTKQFTIQNNGGGTLTISNIAPASSGYFTLTNLPVGFPATSVNLTTGQSMTFSVQYLPTAAGTHSAIFTITSNLGTTPVNVNAVCVDPRITSLPHTQNFDGVTAPAFPLGWTAYKSNTSTSLYASTTYSQTPSNSVYMYNYTTSDIMRLISPQITVPMNSMRLSFYARSGSAGYTLKVGTVNALDGTGVFTQLASYTLTASFTQYILPFTAYAGSDQYICFQHGAASTYQSIYIDNFYLDQLMPNDLAATLVTGSGYGVVGNTLTYDVTVLNNGTASQNSFNVHLKKYGDERLASIAVTDPLAPGASAVYSVSWTPTSGQTGNYSVVGEVELTGDGNSSNNETPAKAIGIYTADAYMPLVGDPLGTTTANTLPTNMYWKNGVTETIYTAQEMQMTAGTIQGMAYFNNFSQDLRGKSMKIWVMNTTTTDLSTSWLPFTGYTLVYDGPLDFPIGTNSIYIPFSTPITYTGGNFAVRVNRVMDTEFFLATNVFYYTTPKYVNSRSRYIQSDSTVYDPLDPGLSGTGTLINDIPVTGFVVTGASPVVLAAPTNVTSTIVGTNAVLNWTAVPGAYGYRIYASATDPYLGPPFPGGVGDDPIAVVWTNSYSFPLGTTHSQFFKVVAISSYRGGDNGGFTTNPPAIIGAENGRLRAQPAIGKTDNKD